MKTTKTTTTLLISLAVVACSKRTSKPQPVPREAAVARTSVRDVAVAQAHVCAVLSTGQVACWGELKGALEPLTTKPEVIPGITGATAISEMDCVLRGDKPAMCWDNDRVVTEVPGTERAKKIVGHDWDPCFLLASGSVTCWDRREKKMTPVAGLSKLRSIDSWGYGEWCYIKDTGAIECSGEHETDLGKTLPSYPDATDVVRVEQGVACVLRQGGVMSCFGLPADVVAANYPTRADEIADRCIRTGDSISCFAWSESASEWTWQPRKLDGKATKLSCDSNTCCVLVDGDVACWGDNGNGRLGDGMASTAKPTKVEGLPPVAHVFGGERFTAALTKEGDVYAWGGFGPGPHVAKNIGSADMITLGGSGVLAASGHSMRVYGPDDKRWGSESLPPLAVDALALAADDTSNVCAALVDNSFRCLRPDANGEQHWVSIAGMTGLVQLSGMGGAICGVTKAGAVACMVDDRGEDEDRPAPNHGVVVPGVTNARRIAGATVELNDGTVVAIGLDEQRHWKVTPKPALTGITAITAGGYGWSASCGLKDEHAHCWFDFGGGDDRMGLLARSSKVPTGEPAPVEGLGEVRAISAGNSHVCAVDTADAVWCWGDDRSGELGRGRVTFRDEAKRVTF